jgi:hypothetical protein
MDVTVMMVMTVSAAAAAAAATFDGPLKVRFASFLLLCCALVLDRYARSAFTPLSRSPCFLSSQQRGLRGLGIESLEDDSLIKGNKECFLLDP